MILKTFSLILTFIIFATSAISWGKGAPPIEAQKTFNASYQQTQQQQSFYCQCPYSLIKQNSYTPYLGTCEYQARNNDSLANKIAWDYVVPLWLIAESLSCGLSPKKKRFKKQLPFNALDSCKNDPEFLAAKNDLINIVPSIAEIKHDRSSFLFSELNFEPRKYGLCDFEVREKIAMAEPQKSIRGDIARITFYMQAQYGIKINKSYNILLQAWQRHDPASLKECQLLRWKDSQQARNYQFPYCE